MTHSRGEIWWGETLTHGRRPYLILTRDEAVGKISELIVCPLTTTIRGLDHEINLGKEDGLPKNCVTSFDNLSTIAKGQLTERITVLPPKRMNEVCRALQVAVGC